MRKAVLIISLLVIIGILISLAVSYKKKGCSLTYWLNPDSVCRVHDESGNRVLVEYFNADTNELRLYVQQNAKDILIEHPYGRSANYSQNVSSNEIRFDRSDSNLLLVNGERFEIVPSN